MAIKEIGQVIKPAEKGDDTPWGTAGSLAGGAIGATLGAIGGLGFGAAPGFAAGSAIGGTVGGLAGAQFADKGSPAQVINPVKSTPLQSFAERSPEVALGQLKKAQMALPDSGLSMNEQSAYQKMMADASARLTQGR